MQTVFNKSTAKVEELSTECQFHFNKSKLIEKSNNLILEEEFINSSIKLKELFESLKKTPNIKN